MVLLLLLQTLQGQPVQPVILGQLDQRELTDQQGQLDQQELTETMETMEQLVTE
jgi:hypothetical protein